MVNRLDNLFLCLLAGKAKRTQLQKLLSGDLADGCLVDGAYLIEV